jgi:hypothetical protein
MSTHLIEARKHYFQKWNLASTSNSGNGEYKTESILKALDSYHEEDDATKQTNQAIGNW